MHGRKNRAQGRRSEQDAADDLSDCGGLAKPSEQASHAVRGKKQDCQRKQQTGKINIMERHMRSPQTAAHAAWHR